MLKYDCIIIGAGIGGLTCAARLAKSGAKILLLEKFGHVGGTASVFHRGKYVFPAGPLSFGYPDYVVKTLKKLGINEKINFKRSHFQFKSKDIDVIFSLPFCKLIEELSSYFPSEKEGIHSYFHIMNRIAEAQADRWEWDPELLEVRNKSESTKHSVKDIKERLAFIRKYQDFSAAELARKHVKDKILHSILANQSLEEGSMSSTLAASMWKVMCEIGIWYPDIGFDGLGNLLSNIILNSGGEIRLFSPASKIIMENGKATGVELEDGEIISTSNVVSCVDHKLTFLKMVVKEALPSDFVNWVRNLKDSGSLFCVYLGIDSAKVDLSAMRASHLFYRAHMEAITWWDEEISSKDFFMNKEYEICNWSEKDKKHAPPERDALILRVNAPYGHFRKWKTHEGGRVKGYHEYKKRVAKFFIQAAETILPGLSSSIEVMDSSTPLTYETWGGGSEGACAGWSWDASDEMGSTIKSLIRTPVPNLYMVGYQAFFQLFMGGLSTAMHSGILSADLIAEE